ncbi:LacI family DNA-binding transcriptional regulator [Labrys sp. KNU-23]|uniref:LacI family DNA-binding transcriptional regulator n=1 Tax=Labrys sp. KNU-23 TaxID=2789216 RepID=UPI0011EC788C|nr:LacI family DNA-binding transcriptional regulator [Labrys sp. KNU-23]QEN89923.1 LacI family DNA-binding transcriptional regulator [Labrys sp. KNU-23]
MSGGKRGVSRATTIVDIARAAGVSKSTVSLVLKDSPLVKSATRDRVIRAIDQLGYVYNRSAASLRTARSSFVGMVISDLMNPFFTELAVGIEDGLHNMGFVPILANTNEDVERQTRVLQSLREHGVAGIIMSPARGTDVWSLAETLPRSLPMVLTMRRVEGSTLPYIGPDNRTGAREAVSHLINLGHRSVAFLGGFGSMTTQKERISGYRDALISAGLPLRDELIFEAMPTRAGGAEAITAALASAHKPTAAFCYNDIVAMGATRALGLRGVRVGIDFAVIGFDDIVEAEHNAPPLTTVNADTRIMGTRAARSLLGLIDGADPEAMSFIGTTRLVVRESCGAHGRTILKETA